MINTDHLHPMIVHFPVALIIIGFSADVVSMFFRNEKCLSKTGFYLMILGAVAAIASWSTGHLFTSSPTEGEFLNIYLRHKTGGLITMILIVAGSAIRVWLVMKKKAESQLKWVVFGLYFLAFCSVAFTGFLGGKMVYDFMMG